MCGRDSLASPIILVDIFSGSPISDGVAEGRKRKKEPQGELFIRSTEKSSVMR